MFLNTSRRGFMAGAAAFTGSLALPLAPAIAAPLALTVLRRTIEVNGRAATVFGIQQDNGRPGLALDPGQRFSVELGNRAGEETIIHWHGMTPPFAADGVAGHGRPLIADGATVAYDFQPRAGTHWMHSHHGLQEQRLMAAPLIVRSDEDRGADMQEVVLLLHDFTFRDPAEILAELTGGGMDHSAHGMDMPGMDMPGMDMPGMDMPGIDMAGMDLNDVDYDAYLANDRTLADPEVVRTERGGRVRLRIINGATSTAFHIDLGMLQGDLVAVDGNAVWPVRGQGFPISMGQRLDIVVGMPSGGGSFPILAAREGTAERTGIILATPSSAVAKVAELGLTETAALDLALERQLVALEPLAEKTPSRRFSMSLTGSMTPYLWSVDGQVFGNHHPLEVAAGERVVIEMINRTHMAHPMHLHGHHFQVVAIDGHSFSGAVRDTVLVPPGTSVSVAFDSDNPGRWPLHCHNLLHMQAGMMTELVYA